ncbi:MAG TPA: T9SS type A sorting domain-containing protein [candidate division WOR-3 bacterium]|uniref:T9SS type A sorting domain-containing protein n=1 Tax=candidate division WOR-3 bacterium TaxID=2052148 RepID=A0A9C9EN01_UNCW3|nr:T9SS type A sorting domain-containing protein [candidate division WOR-3 bacterium]
MATLVLIFMVAVLPPIPGKLTAELSEILHDAASQEKIFVIVHMNTEYPYESLVDMDAQEKCVVFKNVAENSQSDVFEYLKSLSENKVELGGQFWIFNGFHLKATKDVIMALTRRNDIWFICHNTEVHAHRVREDNIRVKKKRSRVVEWNISKVMADSCWTAGYNGSGIILGHIDTGVDVDHPALSGKWLSPYWLDGVNGQPTPYDDNNHGTHTMGTICGGDGPGLFTDDIGIAYGAQYIPTKAFNASGTGTYASIDTCMQYLADLKAGGVDIRAIGNSWGAVNGADLHWWSIVLNWKILGVFPVFSIGNSGPGPGSVGSPGSYPLTIGVGATDSLDDIAFFSSRGPAPNIDPINDPQYWYYSDWNLLKPDVSAPGVDVRSSIPGGGYGLLTGTSMASPHITGGVALLLDKNPYLTVDDIYELLYQNCEQPTQGAPYPNYNYGWGRINLWHSLQATPPGNKPNIKIVRIEVVGGNENGRLDPGETAGIVSYLRNNGGISATGTIAKLRINDSYITINDSTTNLGTILPRDTVDNSADPFSVTVSPVCPEGYILNFQLYIVCAESSWTRNFDLIVGNPGEDYATHDCGNCKLTVTRYGAIGFMGSNQSAGLGFIYPISGPKRLYYGSFAVGTDADYCVDRYFEKNECDDEDWNTVTSPVYGGVRMYEPGPGNLDEYTTALYDDSGHPNSKGLLCEQYSWAWDDPNASEFVTIKFVLKNQGSFAINSLYAALFMDFDIGDYSNNQGSSETARNLTWMYEAGTGAPYYVGVAMLDPPRTTSPANLALIDHLIYVYPYQGLPDSIQIQFMDGTIINPSSNRLFDWSTCNSAGPFNLNPGDSAVVAFAILGGDNLNDLKTNADTAYTRYWNLEFGIEDNKLPSEQSIPQLMLTPVIARNRTLTLRYNLGTATPVNLKIYDVLGRLVDEHNYGVLHNSGEFTVGLNTLAQGIYFVQLETGDYKKTEKVVLIK